MAKGERGPTWVFFPGILIQMAKLGWLACPRRVACIQLCTIAVFSPGSTSALIALPYHLKHLFNRLLVAQAIVEGIPLVSANPGLDRYPITRLW
jgi:PIN domain nuclease of toxin-antitoxin system